MKSAVATKQPPHITHTDPEWWVDTDLEGCRELELAAEPGLFCRLKVSQYLIKIIIEPSVPHTVHCQADTQPAVNNNFFWQANRSINFFKRITYNFAYALIRHWS